MFQYIVSGLTSIFCYCSHIGQCCSKPCWAYWNHRQDDCAHNSNFSPWRVLVVALLGFLAFFIVGQLVNLFCDIFIKVLYWTMCFADCVSDTVLHCSDEISSDNYISVMYRSMRKKFCIVFAGYVPPAAFVSGSCYTKKQSSAAKILSNQTILLGSTLCFLGALLRVLSAVPCSTNDWRVKDSFSTTG